MQDLNELLRAISSLAWPTMVGIVLYKLGPSIKSIFESRSFSVKYGDAELSVQDASDQLRKQVEDLQNQVASLIIDMDPMEPRALTPTMQSRQILWVDDKPSNNAFEVAKFQDDGYQVKQVRSTAEALQVVSDGLSPSIVITDMGRRENGSYVRNAGIVVIRGLREVGINAPIYVYTSQKYAQIHHDQSLEAGGNGATASPVALYKMVSSAEVFDV